MIWIILVLLVVGATVPVWGPLLVSNPSKEDDTGCYELEQR